MKKKSAFLILSFILIFSLNVCAIESPTDLFYAGDFSDVLSEKTENFIIDNSATLCDKTKAQVVVVTVKNLNGQDVMEYGLNILREWQVGDKEKNNGVVILLSTEDRKIGVSVGYGLEGALPDSKVGRLIDTCAIPSFQNDNFDEGIFNLYNAVIGEVYLEYNMEVPQNINSYEEYLEDEEDEEDILLIVGCIILAIFIFVFIMRTKHHGGFYPPGGGYSGHSNNTFGGGFSSGGSSFGGFSGGGGSGGGGGASRGF